MIVADAAAWVAAAIAAGQNPVIIVQPDGRKAIHLNEIDVDPGLRQGFPEDEADFAALITALQAAGRIIDARAPEAPPRMPCEAG